MYILLVNITETEAANKELLCVRGLSYHTPLNLTNTQHNIKSFIWKNLQRLFLKVQDNGAVAEKRFVNSPK
jgi:hypothetical protein